MVQQVEREYEEKESTIRFEKETTIRLVRLASLLLGS